MRGSDFIQHARCAIPAASACSSARSIRRFFRRVWVVNGHAAAFPLAQSGARAAPGAGALKAVAGVMEHLANGLSATVRQSALAQCLAQGHHRPGARLILLVIRRALHRARACVCAARSWRSATCSKGEGEKAALVEATHASTQGILALASRTFCRLGRGCSCSDREQRLCSLDDIQALDVRIVPTLSGVFLLPSERTSGIFWPVTPARFPPRFASLTFLSCLSRVFL